MASAQVMPNSAVSSRKQKDLEAGRRRLEEFRKKKKKNQGSNSTVNEKQVLENGKADLLDTQTAGTSGRTSDIVTEPSDIAATNAKELHISSQQNGAYSHSDQFSNPPMPENRSLLSDLPQEQFKGQEQLKNDTSVWKYPLNSSVGQQQENKFSDDGSNYGEGRPTDVPLSKQSSYSHVSGVRDALLDKDSGPYGISKTTNSHSYNVGSLFSKQFSSSPSQNHSDYSQPAHGMPLYASNYEQSMHSNAASNHFSEGNGRNHKYYDYSSSHSDVQSYQTSSGLFNLNVGEIASKDPPFPDTQEAFPKRNRPSFLDSLNINKVSSTSAISHAQPQKLESEKVSVDDMDAGFQSQNVFANDLARRVDVFPQKPSEDFVALEQHIEDLTQEKFSLQKAMEASKALAESLASENSSLTESYNQQGGVVSQLKSDIERLQAEINSLLAELESSRIQYTNALLECNAADERAKLLATEVVGLEEKALRLRYNELKLEKELEKSNANAAAYKNKISRMEKEHQDLLHTLDALQEEKKLLLEKLRTSISSGQSSDSSEKRPKKDISTSTADLDPGVSTSAYGDDMDTFSTTSNQGAPESSAYASDADPFLQLKGIGLDTSTATIPHDQAQMIQNINALLSELMLEKQELRQALLAEISSRSQLKNINKELSHRLEVQTQRLELLTSQSMTKEILTVRQRPMETPEVQENGVSYADEGDEVVERVLGWIMKLFPGGPSKRSSKRI